MRSYKMWSVGHDAVLPDVVIEHDGAQDVVVDETDVEDVVGADNDVKDVVVGDVSTLLM